MEKSGAYPNLNRIVPSQDLKHGLCCAHININGFYKKLDEVKLLLHQAKFDILSLLSIPSKVVEHPGMFAVEYSSEYSNAIIPGYFLMNTNGSLDLIDQLKI